MHLQVSTSATYTAYHRSVVEYLETEAFPPFASPLYLILPRLETLHILSQQRLELCEECKRPSSLSVHGSQQMSCTSIFSSLTFGFFAGTCMDFTTTIGPSLDEGRGSRNPYSNECWT